MFYERSRYEGMGAAVGDTHELTTRREILKRGAIVGGGVLWVTPVVQTLGMGTASAQAVSGPGTDPCKMTLELLGCQDDSYRGGPGQVKLSLRATIPEGCPCHPDPSSTGQYAYLLVDGQYASQSMGPHLGQPGWYGQALNVTGPVQIQAVCIKSNYVTGVGWVRTIKAQSDPLDFTQDAYGACVA